jgi:quercetin dioxygenase-like cupin family protein
LSRFNRRDEQVEGRRPSGTAPRRARHHLAPRCWCKAAPTAGLSNQEIKVKHWNLQRAGSPTAPQILSSTDEGRAVLLHVAAGEALREHQVHERAWVTIVHGEAEVVSTESGEERRLSAPSLVEFSPGERHELRAITDISLLLLLTPWPGEGHPGATPLDLKAEAHTLALQQQG